jgi:WD40 repeat protein
MWVEEYLDRHPHLQEDAEGVMDLIYNEVFLRAQRQEAPELKEYVARFPQLASELRDQFDVHRLLEGQLLDAARPSAEKCERADERPEPLPVQGQIFLPGYGPLLAIGRGGFGIVYKARQTRPARVVAIKMLRTEAGPSLKERFAIEAEAIACLKHAHIVQIFEVGKHNGQPYLTLEYVEGGSLANRLSSGPLAVRQAAEITETLAHAMHYAHQQGVVHRDLKPANVLLTSEGAPKITDFGFAKLLVGGGASPTQSEATFGTPSYIAPEQAHGRSREAGPAADVYALGAILYEMLTGRPPFLADTPLETLRMVVTAEAVSPAYLQPRVPRDLETICMKCLQKEVTKRYASALSLADDLRRFLKGEPVRARPVSRVERLWRWSKRNPVVASLTAAVFVLFATVAGVASVGYVREAEQRSAAEASEGRANEQAQRAWDAEERMRRQWYAASMNAMQQAWDTGQVARLQALLAETESYPERGFEWYYFQRLCHLELQIFIGHRADVMAVSWSPDGKWLATGSRDGTAKVWEVAGGRELLTLKGHTSAVWSVSWSPDGKRLATASADETAKVWDAAGGREVLTLGHTSPVESVSWSPDGKALATGSYDGTAKVWEGAGGRELCTLQGHTSHIQSVSWSPDGKWLATGSGDGTAKVWQAVGGREPITLRGHANEVKSVFWSPDGKRLATASADGKAKVWDAAGGRELLTLQGHTSLVVSVSWSPNGKFLATGSDDMTAKLWDVASGRELRTFKGHPRGVTSVSWSPDGKRLATGSFDGTAKVWEAVGGRQLLSFKGPARPIWSVSWSPDGTRLMTGGQDETAKVWEAAGDRVLFFLQGHTGPAGSVAWSRDGKLLATGSGDRTAKIWDAVAGRELRTLHGHTGSVLSVSWSPDGNLLATGSLDGTAKVWDAAGGQELRTLKGHTGVVSSVSWSPDGKRLATGSFDGTAKVWEAVGGRELRSLRGHTSEVRRVSWSPDGIRLATASQDGTAKVWEATTGRELLSLKDHTRVVWSVCWSPDGTRLATGSYDGTAKVWEAAGGRELLSLKGHTSGVVSVSWSPDGTRLATGSDDGTAKVWEAAGAEAVHEWACQDRTREDFLALNVFRGPQAKGFIQTWLLLLPFPLAPGDSGRQALDRQQLPAEASLKPKLGERVRGSSQELVWREHRSPEAVLDFNAVLEQVTERSVAYAACYLESDRSRNDLWLQVASDDQGKVYVNGREIYQSRLPRTLDTVGPVKLQQGTNVLVFKVVNEMGSWEGFARLVDAAGRPATEVHVKLTP